MILAQNHQLPLSGNKYILSILLVTLFSFCAETKPLFTVEPNSAKKDTPITSNIERKNKADDDIVVIEDTVKKHFKVLLLLPLFLSDIVIETDSEKVANTFTNSKLGIELYQGIKYAFDSLAAETGHSFTLNISDTKNNEETLKNALISPNFYDADLAIGPVYNNMLKIAANQAKKYNVPLVSPLSPAENITQDNKRFFMVNPGIKAHLNTLLAFAKTQHATDNIIIVRQGADKDYSNYFQRNINNTFSCKELIYNAGKYSNAKNKEDLTTDLKSRLRTNLNNVIVVPSIDLQFVHKLSRELYNLSTDYPIVVLGLPVWSPENDLRLDYLEKINTHFTQASYIDDSLLHDAVFAQRFFDLYGQYSNEINIKGFDIAFFFGKQLIQHGKDFYKHIEEANDTSIHTTFNFKPSYTEGSMQEEMKLLYYENKKVHLFRIEEYMLKKLR